MATSLGIYPIFRQTYMTTVGHMIHSYPFFVCLPRPCRRCGTSETTTVRCPWRIWMNHRASAICQEKDLFREGFSQMNPRNMGNIPVMKMLLPSNPSTPLHTVFSLTCQCNQGLLVCCWRSQHFSFRKGALPNHAIDQNIPTVKWLVKICLNLAAGWRRAFAHPWTATGLGGRCALS